MSTRKPPRQMAAKACERCRRRKIKCDEYYPCGQCTKMRVTCKIEDPAEKRREQQQSVMEDRIKRLEALLVATYTNPNNRLDMNIPGLDQEGLLPNSALGASPGPSSSQGMKPEPPRLTLQTPATQDFMSAEPNELLSTSDFSFGVPYWSPPSSIAPSVPASASDYFGSDPPPWSTTVTAGNSGDSTPPNQGSRRNSRVRASSLSTSEPSTQDEILGSPISNDRNRFSVDTSGSTLGIPQIEVTSWDQSRPQTPAGHSPALSPASMMDLGDIPSFYPPELSIGSWSGLSSPTIMAPSFQFEDNLLVANQSLPSHSRRSSVNSLAPDYDAYNEPKRRRATSDVFPVPQQFVYPEGDLTDSPYGTNTPTPTTAGLQPSLTQTTQLPMQESPAKSDLFNRTFCEVVYPLFPILSPQSMPRNPTQNFSPTASANSHTNQSCLSPEIAQTQSLLIRAISSYILCRRSSQNTLPAQNYFIHGLQAHGVGKWDSLPGIQTGILLAVFILISGCQGPNLYILNSNIVAACLDLGLHKGGSNPGSLEANTLLAAYVLDRTVGLVRDRPSLLKDEDMEHNTLAMVRNQLREMVERGRVRRWPEGGRLWDWWAEYEVNLREGHLDIDLAAALGGQQLDASFAFADM